MQTFRITDLRPLPGDSAFLLDDGECAILCDTGFGFTGKILLEKLRAALGNRALDYILLTHSHYDHALSSAEIARAYPGARVIAGAYAAGIFQKNSAKRLMRELDVKFAARCGMAPGEDLTDLLHVDVSLEDGDRLCLGGHCFEALLLPGHTRCSVGYYCEEQSLLLSCETLGVYDGKGGVVPSYLVGYEMTLASIRRVKALSIRHILVPHYGLLSFEDAENYLCLAEKSAIASAETIASMLREKRDKREILNWFRETFYHGHIKEIYPVDAMELNTGITIDLIEREFFGA